MYLRLKHGKKIASAVKNPASNFSFRSFNIKLDEEGCVSHIIGFTEVYFVHSDSFGRIKTNNKNAARLESHRVIPREYGKLMKDGAVHRRHLSRSDCTENA